MYLNLQKKIVIMFFLISIALCANANNQDTRPYELESSNNRLNKVYKKILDRLQPDEQIKLRKSQRAWIIFRDLDCKWAFSAEPLDCLVDRTDNRANELENTVFSDLKNNYGAIEK